MHQFVGVPTVHEFFCTSRPPPPPPLCFYNGPITTCPLSRLEYRYNKRILNKKIVLNYIFFLSFLRSSLFR